MNNTVQLGTLTVGATFYCYGIFSYKIISRKSDGWILVEPLSYKSAQDGQWRSCTFKSSQQLPSDLLVNTSCGMNG